MERIEFALIVGLVLAIAAGLAFHHHRDSRPPIQPAVVYGQSRFEPYHLTTPTPAASAAEPRQATGVPAPLPPASQTAPGGPQAPAATPTPDPALAALNQASLERLTEITGIGPVLAERIAKAREAGGGFSTWTELNDVPGIGDKRLEEIRRFFMLETQAGGATAPESR